MTRAGTDTDGGDDHESETGVGEALALIGRGVARLHSVGLEALSNEALRSLLPRLETDARRIASVQVDVLAEVDRRGLHRADGHASAKVMVRHQCRLSGVEAARRARMARAAVHLPILFEAWRRGEIGTDQIDLVARIHANPRVREALSDFQADALLLARSCTYPDFEITMRRWERLADADGPEPRSDAGHHNRHVALRQNQFDLGWRLDGSFGALQGATVSGVLRHFADAEWERDWAEARARHGEAAAESHLARTPAQRMADALERICERAAAASPDSPGIDLVTTVVWSEETYFATLHRITCNDPDCNAPGHGAPGRWYDPDTYRCETIDGVQLEPTEAALATLGSQIRRAVVNARGVTIDLGRKARLFTGPARIAVQLHSTRCLWPGCWVPTSCCDADHIEPHIRGGPTNAENGVPMCSRHNRWRAAKGFSTWRDPSGRWHVSRPDGTELR